MEATQAEDRLRRTDAFMRANDTATLSSGVTTQETSRQAQRAADVIAAWDFQWKMRVAALHNGASAGISATRDVSHSSLHFLSILCHKTFHSFAANNLTSSHAKKIEIRRAICEI